MLTLYQISWAPYLLLFWLSLDILLAIRVRGPPGGVDPNTGARPFRYEISKFQYSGAAFDLYILALSVFEGVNQSDPLSYFQISGIHGFPHIPWDGVSGAGSYPGFCMHAATPFPTWHRPYLALFEVALHSDFLPSPYHPLIQASKFYGLMLKRLRNRILMSSVLAIVRRHLPYAFHIGIGRFTQHCQI